MMEPQRLLFDPEASDFERVLPRSWEPQGPSSATRERILALSGAACGAALVGTIAGGSIPPKAGVAGLGIAKWLAAVALIAGASGGTTAAVRQFASAPAVPSAMVSPPPKPVASSARVEAPASPIASLAAPVTPVVEPRAATKVAAPRPTDLSTQVAAVDRARNALRDGNSVEARRLIDEYEARYPTGAFVQEAETLRVEALITRGDDAGAQAAATRFLAQYPSSPHAARIRALAGPR